MIASSGLPLVGSCRFELLLTHSDSYRESSLQATFMLECKMQVSIFCHGHIYISKHIDDKMSVFCLLWVEINTECEVVKLSKIATNKNMQINHLQELYCIHLFS